MHYLVSFIVFILLLGLYAFPWAGFADAFRGVYKAAQPSFSERDRQLILKKIGWCGESAFMAEMPGYNIATANLFQKSQSEEEFYEACIGLSTRQMMHWLEKAEPWLEREERLLIRSRSYESIRQVFGTLTGISTTTFTLSYIRRNNQRLYEYFCSDSD